MKIGSGFLAIGEVGRCGGCNGAGWGVAAGVRVGVGWLTIALVGGRSARFTDDVDACDEEDDDGSMPRRC